MDLIQVPVQYGYGMSSTVPPWLIHQQQLMWYKACHTNYAKHNKGAKHLPRKPTFHDHIPKHKGCQDMSDFYRSRSPLALPSCVDNRYNQLVQQRTGSPNGQPVYTGSKNYNSFHKKKERKGQLFVSNQPQYGYYGNDGYWTQGSYSYGCGGELSYPVYPVSYGPCWNYALHPCTPMPPFNANPEVGGNLYAQAPLSPQQQWDHEWISPEVPDEQGQSAEELVTASQPPQRPWIPLAHPERSRPVAIYTVMCYNVLCDKYATRQLYGYCPSWALNWEYRKKGIIEEIRHYSADIISLQEVETDQFYNFFLPELKRDGYDGIFSPKSRARTMTEADRKHVDGCAIFYRTNKFSLVKKHLIEFNQLAMASAEGSHDMLNRVMTKDNIGLAAILETKEAVWENGTPPESSIRQPILVATCHIHWDPEFCDVKLIQTMMLLKELKGISDEALTSLRPGASSPDSAHLPLILCGDLNSLPESGVVEFLVSGKVSTNHDDFKDIGYDDCLSKMCNGENNKDIYSHVFKLAPSYTKDIMPFTNYTFDFKGIIDYIFFSKEYMRPLGVLGPLDLDWFRESKVLGCPHPHIPSDHLPLLVEFEFGALAQVPALSANPTPNTSSSNTTSSSNQNQNQSVPNNTASRSNNARR